MSSSERSQPLRNLIALCITSLAIFATGCAMTNTQTARQLDSGELVVAGTIDMPGYLFVPRLSGHLSYGYGPGDVSIRAGTALLSNFIGVGTRVYPSKWINISLDADLNAIMVPFSGGPDDWMPMLAITPRVSTSTSSTRFVYGGIQSNVLVLDPIQITNEPNNKVALLGALVGADWRSTTGFGVQAELIFSPFAYNISERVLIASLLEPGGELSGFVEFSLGLYWSRPPGGRRAQNIPPTQTPTSKEQEQPKRPAPAPTPRYDEDDVPLY